MDAVTATVVEITVEGIGAWVAIILGVLGIIAALYKAGRVVHDCFDGLRKENEALNGKMDDLLDTFTHEAEMQKYRHASNQAALAEQREKIALVDSELTKTRLDVAGLRATVVRSQ